MITQNTVVLFEGGNIGTGIRYYEQEKIGELSLGELSENREIGKDYKLSDLKDGFPVTLLFKKKSSIDVLIKQLEKIKEKMED